MLPPCCSHRAAPSAYPVRGAVATFENVCYDRNGAGSFCFSNSSAACPPGPCIWSLRHPDRSGWHWPFVFRRPWLTCTGTVGILGNLHGACWHLQSADAPPTASGRWSDISFPLPSSSPCLQQGCSIGSRHCFADRFPLFFRAEFLNFQIWVKGIDANCIIGDREDGKQPALMTLKRRGTVHEPKKAECSYGGNSPPHTGFVKGGHIESTALSAGCF